MVKLMSLYSYIRSLLWIALFTLFTPLQGNWSPPSSLTGTGYNSDASQIKTDSQGNLHAVWTYSNGLNNLVQYSTKTIVGEWSPPIVLSEEGENASFPQIAFDSNNNAIAIWTRNNNTYPIVQASIKRAGEDWSTPENLSDPGQGAYNISINIDFQGNAIVVWQRSVDGHSTIQASTRNFNATSWSAPINISETGLDSNAARVTIDQQGNIHVIWYKGGIVQTRSRLFGETSWTPIVNLSTGPDMSFDVQIASDIQGNLTAVWRNGTNRVIQTSSKPYNENTWSTPINISEVNQDTYDPAIAIDQMGNITVAWDVYNGNYGYVQARRKPFGGSWEAIETLSEDGVNTYTAQIAVDYQGNVTVIWEGNDGNNDFIQSAKKPFGESWTSPVFLSQQGFNSYYPSLDVDLYGNAYAIWTQYDGANSIVKFASNILPPAITEVSPQSGPIAGGNLVTLTGMNFIHVTSVLFGSQAAAQFNIISPTSITAIAPQGSGEVDIIIVSEQGSSLITSSSRYSYQNAILPPTHFRGKRVKHIFATQIEYVNKLSWRPSQSPDIARYVLYRNGKELKTFSAKDKRYIYKDRNQKKHRSVTYTISSQNSQGEESEAISITIR